MVIYSYPPSNMVEGNLHNKELKIMGKLEQYAKRLKQNAKKAEAYIGELEKAGFTVSPAVKEVVEQSLNAPDRIAQKTYKRAMISLNKHRIKSTSRLTTDKVYYPKQIGAETYFTPDKPITLSLHGTPTQMTKQLERLIRKAKPTTQLYQALIDLVDEEGFDVDSTAHATTYDINKYFRITKTLPVDLIRDLASYANVDPETREASEKDSDYRKYMSNIKNRRKNKKTGNYDPSPLANIDDETILKLESVMSSSTAWKLAGAYDEGLESEQVQENWTRIYKAAEDADKKNDEFILNDLLNAVENDDFKTANDIVNKRIGQAMSRTFKQRKRKRG